MDFGTPRPTQDAAAELGAPNGRAKETSSAEFANDVLAASRDVTVIVDFYSSASPQSQQHSQSLENAVHPYADKIRLIKLNIDKNPAIAGQLRLQTVPTVYAFRDGRPIDGFAGAQPDNVVQEFVGGLAGAEQAADLATVLKAGIEALETGELQSAAEIFATVLQADPHNGEALAGLSQCYLKSGDIGLARQTIELVPPDKQDLNVVQAVLAALELADKAGDAGETAELERKLAANPSDHQARFDLAVALAASGGNADAVDHLLEIFKNDRQWNDEAARKQLLQFFEAWGSKDQATIDGRRRLSSLLFS
ncbi:MAG: tetratricopeptide repeat protein [Hyphomicrobiaceae bacterium]